MRNAPQMRRWQKARQLERYERAAERTAALFHVLKKKPYEALPRRNRHVSKEILAFACAPVALCMSFFAANVSFR